jgi:hypothetical protein
MPRATIVKAGLMKKCSHCPTTYVGSDLVQANFGCNQKAPDGFGYQCKRCTKRASDKARAKGRAYLADMKALTGCENPLCECAHGERAKREVSLHYHHLDLNTKVFPLSRGTDKPIEEQIEERHKTVLICTWSHDQAHMGNKGELSPYGIQMALAHKDRLAQFETSRSVGAGVLTVVRE